MNWWMVMKTNPFENKTCGPRSSVSRLSCSLSNSSSWYKEKRCSSKNFCVITCLDFLHPWLEMFFKALLPTLGCKKGQWILRMMVLRMMVLRVMVLRMMVLRMMVLRMMAFRMMMTDGCSPQGTWWYTPLEGSLSKRHLPSTLSLPPSTSW